jgi:TrkA-N domain
LVKALSTAALHSLSRLALTDRLFSLIFPADVVLVVGYGRVGKMVCDMLDRQLIPYVAIDNSPQRAREARKAGLPVYFGDANRPEVLKSFNADSTRACVVTIDDQSAINKVVESMTKLFPKVPVIARAVNTQHQKRLVGSFANVYALCPMLPEDSVLLTLPFGGAVLQQIGVSKPEIDAILEDFRFQYMEGSDESTVDFFTSWQKRLPPSTPLTVAEEGAESAESEANAPLFDPIDETLTALQGEPEVPSSSSLNVDDTIDAALMGADVDTVVVLEDESTDPRLPFEG